MRKLAILSILAAALVGCQNSDLYSNNVYTANQAKQGHFVSYGTVTSIRPVKIQTNAHSNGQSDTLLGSVGGAVIGGLLGNTIGGGTGRALATAGGAIAGSVVGSKIEDGVSKTDALEIGVRRDNGKEIVVVEKAARNEFFVGQKVRVMSLGNQLTIVPSN